MPAGFLALIPPLPPIKGNYVRIHSDILALPISEELKWGVVVVQERTAAMVRLEGRTARETDFAAVTRREFMRRMDLGGRQIDRVMDQLVGLGYIERQYSEGLRGNRWRLRWKGVSGPHPAFDGFTVRYMALEVPLPLFTCQHPHLTARLRMTFVVVLEILSEIAATKPTLDGTSIYDPQEFRAGDWLDHFHGLNERTIRMRTGDLARVGLLERFDGRTAGCPSPLYRPRWATPSSVDDRLIPVDHAGLPVRFLSAGGLEENAGGLEENAGGLEENAGGLEENAGGAGRDPGSHVGRKCGGHPYSSQNTFNPPTPLNPRTASASVVGVHGKTGSSTTLRGTEVLDLLGNLSAQGASLTPPQLSQIREICPWNDLETLQILEAILACLGRRELQGHPSAVLYTALTSREGGKGWLPLTPTSREATGASLDTEDPPNPTLPRRLEQACLRQKVPIQKLSVEAQGFKMDGIWAVAYADLAERPRAQPWGGTGWHLPTDKAPLELPPLKSTLAQVRGIPMNLLADLVQTRVEDAQLALDKTIRESPFEERTRFKEAFTDWCLAAIHGSRFLLGRGALSAAGAMTELLVYMLRSHVRPEGAPSRTPLGQALDEDLIQAAKQSNHAVRTASLTGVTAEDGMVALSSLHS